MKITEEKSNPVVLYHANCPDGYTAAWAAVQAMPDAEICPVTHGEPPPFFLDGRDVVIVDFAYPRAVLLDLYERTASLRVIDHHKTAEEDLRGLDFCTFDMQRSGAGLAWDVLCGTPRPWIIDYVEDRDLWRFHLPDSLDVNAAIMATPQTLEGWSELADMPLDSVISDGRAIRRHINTYCENLIEAAARQACGMGVLGSGVWGGVFPIINAPFTNVSDLLNAMLGGEGTIAVAWWQRADGKYQWSLRGNGVDVSAIARAYGGGGHESAAGFVTVLPPDAFVDFKHERGT